MHTALRQNRPSPPLPPQVSSAAALSKGDLVAALTLARQASALEVAAELLMLPSSTTLFFIPGTAFHGVVSLRIASVAAAQTSPSASSTLALDGATAHSLLKEASTSFDACLLGRPNLSACLLGSARTQSAQGDKKKARAAYAQLLAGWQAVKGGVPAKQSCKKSWKEAQAHLAA